MPHLRDKKCEDFAIPLNQPEKPVARRGPMAQSKGLHSITLGQVRYRAIGGARILFGLVWAIDAFFKWEPAFYTKFSDYISGAAQGQAPWVVSWLSFWQNLVAPAPATFGIIVAIIETLIAIGLLTGAFSNLVQIGGGIWSLVIWTVPEGFGGPYMAGSTDVGASIVYFILFAALFAARAGVCMGVDSFLTPLLGKAVFLASGPIPAEEPAPHDAKRHQEEK